MRGAGGEGVQVGRAVEQQPPGGVGSGYAAQAEGQGQAGTAVEEIGGRGGGPARGPAHLQRAEAAAGQLAAADREAGAAAADREVGRQIGLHLAGQPAQHVGTRQVEETRRVAAVELVADTGVVHALDLGVVHRCQGHGVGRRVVPVADGELQHLLGRAVDGQLLAAAQIGRLDVHRVRGRAGQHHVVGGGALA